MTVVNRTETARALAKAIAYAEAGKTDAAEIWAKELVLLLKCGGILK